MEILFGIIAFAFFYSYIGYGLLLFLLTLFMKKKNNTNNGAYNEEELPEICLFITAYNERDILDEKIINCLNLNYPKDKLEIVFVTDGSNDGSYEYLRVRTEVKVYHEDARKGKITAMNRGMQFVTASIVVFTDANTFLNSESIYIIANEFRDFKVGCVAGSKKVINRGKGNAVETGEGLYWKLESWLKTKDAEFNSAVGAVGELFAIRTKLFEPVEKDVILDDFIISLSIVEKGYTLKYAGDAIATEYASFNVKEELKRKKRIAAGGIQSIFKMKQLLNPFKNGKLAFQYFSHKVSRWTFAPWCFFSLFPINAIIAFQRPESIFFGLTMLLQIIFYLLSITGWTLEKKSLKFKIPFIAYYFTAINFATIQGQFRYFTGKQSAAWDKVKRS
jgi:cellulose synthase/poly-beta-1,6-N-acetylglucosamine synthase-like glycosyltransferase